MLLNDGDPSLSSDTEYINRDQAVEVARELRVEMLRSRVSAEAFVVGPDYAGNVGVGSLDVHGDGALGFIQSVKPTTLTKGGISVRGHAPKVTAFMESLGSFVREPLVGMIGTDVENVPRPPLPDPLMLTRV